MKHLELQVKGVGEKRPIIIKKINLENTLIDDKLLNKKYISLRELITEIVKLEVDEFNNRVKNNRIKIDKVKIDKVKDDKLKNDKVEDNNVLRYLTDNEIKSKVSTGKISTYSVQNLTNVDIDEAIETAILGFEDGLYFVFIDDKKIESIDEIINLDENSLLMFLRLTSLTGGYF